MAGGRVGWRLENGWKVRYQQSGRQYDEHYDSESSLLGIKAGKHDTPGEGDPSGESDSLPALARS